MNPLGTLRAYRRLSRNQRLAPDAILALQQRKLARLVPHAYATVPYYRRLFDAAGVDPAGIKTPADLERIPFTTKADLQAAGVDATTSTAFARDDLIREKTSGSTGQPFTTYFDRAFLSIRNALFLRTLVAAGYRPGQRLLLVTDERPKQPPAWMRWRYALNLDGDEGLARAFAEFRPHVVYGPVSPLRRMAVGLEAKRVPWKPRAVVTTAETLEPAVRTYLKAVFGADVFDAYGLTESGMLAWECAQHAGYHLSEDTALVELLPEAEPGEGRPMVVTTLDLVGMPFIRYRTNDLVRPGAAGRCRCGRTFRRLERIEGRLVDCIRLADGRAVSPYALTHVLGPIPGLERYRVVQEDLRGFLVQYEQKSRRAGPDEGAVRSGLKGLLGADAQIRVEGVASLEPPPGRKFRLVECRLDRG